MKKFLSLFLGAILCTFAFVSCEDILDEVDPSPNVNITDLLPIDDQSIGFDITIQDEAIRAIDFEFLKRDNFYDGPIDSVIAVLSVFKNFEVWVKKSEGTESKNAWGKCHPYIMNSGVSVDDFTTLLKKYISTPDEISDEEKSNIDEMRTWLTEISIKDGEIKFPVKVFGLEAATMYYIRMCIEMSNGQKYYSEELINVTEDAGTKETEE